MAELSGPDSSKSKKSKTNNKNQEIPDVYVLEIEKIGNPRLGFQNYGVWKIVDILISGEGFKKFAQKGFTDYSEANSVGSRGVHQIYFLRPGCIYEVLQPLSWKKVDHYYCRIKNGQIIRMNIHQVIAWLKNSWV